ncbi:MAG: PQQ-dependent sugar dehydrogenase, partial [Candidatus Promineifilaceae bacterium]
ITGMEFMDDGRLFVSEVTGQIYIVETDGTVNPTLFIDLGDRVGSDGKQALSSFVFHPQFETNVLFYVNYTDSQNITHLSRFHTMPSDPDQGDPNSEETMLTVVQPTDLHNGAGMVFGPDGYLYFGMGDGGGFDDPSDNGQNGQTYLGAIMRVDVDGAFPYEIPPDNPFVGNPDVLDEIWALGLRNPWRTAFDSATDDFYIADVGESLWEEIDFEEAGSGGGNNYGWRCYQGFYPYITDGCGSAENYTFPVYVRTHHTMCAIIGGYVYRGSLYPMMDGHYLFADYCSGRVRGLLKQPDDAFEVASTGRIYDGIVTTFGQAPDGELFAAAHGDIYRITAETITLTPRSYLPLIQFDN